jgi:hypothetical protein
MRTPGFDRLLTTLMALATVACEDKAGEPKAGGTKAAGSAVAAASFTPTPAEPPPMGCKAGHDKPVNLGIVVGDVHGFAHDALHVYYTSWELYGSRGEVGALRKDGKGSKRLSLLQLEPRGLVAEKTALLYTSGIRLMAIPKGGGETTILAPQFSAQQLAIHAEEVYGVPGDYGPYDRVAKIPAKGGETKELASSKRPAREEGPKGFSRVAVDASGIYVTDSGGNRILRYPLEGQKPKVLAGGVDKPFDLALVGSEIYFNLARKGELMAVSKTGGAAKKLASGLATNSRIAADEKGIYATVSGKDESQVIVKVAPKSGEITAIAPVAAPQKVDAIALDEDCVYWAQRVDSSKTIVHALGR